MEQHVAIANAFAFKGVLIEKRFKTYPVAGGVYCTCFVKILSDLSSVRDAGRRGGGIMRAGMKRGLWVCTRACVCAEQMAVIQKG